MGVPSISRVFRTAIDSIGGAMMSAFQPAITKYYADDDINGLVRYARWSMKAFGLVLALPIGGFIAFGTSFFSLWAPSQNPSTLYPLAVMSISTWALLGPAAVVQNIFTVLNKVKTNSLLLCAGGILIVIIEYVGLTLSDYGINLIAATSCVESLIRNLLYTIPAGGRYLGLPWWTFVPSVGISLFAVIVVSICGFAVQLMMGVPENWAALIEEGLVSVSKGHFAALDRVFARSDKHGKI